MMPLLAAFGSLLLHAEVVTHRNTCQPNMMLLLRVTSDVVHAVQCAKIARQAPVRQSAATDKNILGCVAISWSLDPQGLVLCPHCLSLLMYTVPAR